MPVAALTDFRLPAEVSRLVVFVWYRVRRKAKPNAGPKLGSGPTNITIVQNSQLPHYKRTG